MPRKRGKDLRDFWPWYERSWHIGEGAPAQPPPFTLDEIAGKEPPVPGLRWLRLVYIAMGALFVVLFVWGLFY